MGAGGGRLVLSLMPPSFFISPKEKKKKATILWRKSKNWSEIKISDFIGLAVLRSLPKSFPFAHTSNSRKLLTNVIQSLFD
jgi:hypothetical protein